MWFGVWLAAVGMAVADEMEGSDTTEAPSRAEVNRWLRGQPSPIRLRERQVEWQGMSSRMQRLALAQAGLPAVSWTEVRAAHPPAWVPFDAADVASWEALQGDVERGRFEAAMGALVVGIGSGVAVGTLTYLALEYLTVSTACAIGGCKPRYTTALVLAVPSAMVASGVGLVVAGTRKSRPAVRTRVRMLYPHTSARGWRSEAPVAWVPDGRWGAGLELSGRF